MTPDFDTLATYYLEEAEGWKELGKKVAPWALGAAGIAAIPHIVGPPDKFEPSSDRPAPKVAPAEPTVETPAAAPQQQANQLPDQVYTWIFDNETQDLDGDGDRDANLTAYDDGAGNMTIGVGHHLQGTAADRRQLAAVTNTNYDQLVAGTAQLTEDEALQLFRNDIDLEYLPAVIDRVPQFNDMGVDAQSAMLDAQYRGDLGDDTVDLINANAPGERIATEYLNHRGYATANRRGLPGIRVRMNANAAVFRNLNPRNNR